MRKEMVKHDEMFPQKRDIPFIVQSLLHRLRMWHFRKSLSNLNVGSYEWHILQEKLSHLSSVGIDMQKRIAFYESTLPKCGGKLRVYPGVVIYYPRNVTLGNNVLLNRGVYIVAPVAIKISDSVLIGPYTVLNSGSHLFADRSRTIRGQGHRYAPIEIEDDVWVGSHVTILPGVTIGKGAVIAAGAVVTKAVEPYTVVAGVPARLLKYRGD